uniref:Mating type protein 1-1-1 n=5 Tax=Calonectria candelabrum species complex TaxID=2779498 RepID=A0A7S5WS39_9HYPO|nr:mating type protein 1-1-1 [Calonectria pauciramosa]
MATRANLMRHLSGLRTDELLTFLDDEALFALAAKFFEKHPDNVDADRSLNAANGDASNEHSSVGDVANNPQAQEVVNEAPSPRPKRPLNAFMAFRTYYLKIFPDVQQKTASGFLTTLWSKEPCRNKWALIAKVYSFARDEVGKGNISLACFLSLCCPIMKIMDPSVYLNTLGWIIQEDETGSQKLVQDPSIDNDHFQSEAAPTTEIELLQAILDTGYLSQQGRILMARLSANNNGMMTTSQLPAETPQLITQQKIDYCHLVSTNPIQAAKNLLGPHYNEDVLRALGIRTIQIDDMDSIPYGMLQAPQPDPIQFYNYSEVNMEFTQDRALQFGVVQPVDPIDIDSPYDIDATIGYRRSEGDRTAGLPQDVEYDTEMEFQFERL